MTGREYTMDQERLAPYHRMGIKVDEGTTLTDAMEIAHLNNWNVRLSPMLTFNSPTPPEGEEGQAQAEADENGLGLQIVDVPGKYVTVADHPHEADTVIAVGSGMTGDYAIVQNEEVAAFGSEVIHASADEVIVEAIGSWMGGSRAFIVFRRPDHIEIAGDVIQPFFLLGWGHDGNTSITMKQEAIRPFCTNMLDGMLGSRTTPVFRVRHTGSTIEGKVQQAREALQVMVAGTSELEKAITEWASKEVTARTFDKIVEGLFPSPDDEAPAGAAARWHNRVDLYRNLWFEDPAKDTAWGALNAWTEMGDWYGNFANVDAAAIAQMTSPQLSARRRNGARIIADTLPGRPLTYVA